MPPEQNYKNHVRWFPLFHFVVVPLLLLCFTYLIVRFFQEPGPDRGMWVVLALALILMNFAARLQALKAQDRVIRLEERLRYREMLSPEIAANAQNLPAGKMISLRFASDGELAELITRVIDGKVSTAKEIKMAIREWRADHLRV